MMNILEIFLNLNLDYNDKCVQFFIKGNCDDLESNIKKLSKLFLKISNS